MRNRGARRSVADVYGLVEIQLVSAPVARFFESGLASISRAPVGEARGRLKTGS
jgi:hypothetical protein